MFDKFESIILQIIICLSALQLNSCLNITEMIVPSVVWAPEKTVLTCVKQQDTENDTFIDIHWFKLVGNQWKLIKIYPQPPPEPMRADTPSEMKAEEGEPEETPKEDPPEETPKEDPPEETPKEVTEEPPKEETPEETPQEDPPKETNEEPSKETPEAKPEEKPERKPKKEQRKEPEYYKLNEMNPTDDSNIELSQTSLSSAGLYKCVLNSVKEMREEIKEMRVFYKPEEGSKPELSLSKLQDNHISFKCKAPASYPIMALNFFINYESAPHEEVHRLPPMRTRNTTYGATDELLINVEELRLRATKQNVLNGNISIICMATLADIHYSFEKLEIKFNGILYQPKCLSAPIIILIVVAVIIVIIIIIAVVWLFLRKKKLNSLNKVAELFNKQKTITVLVDNNINDLKIE